MTKLFWILAQFHLSVRLIFSMCVPESDDKNLWFCPSVKSFSKYRLVDLMLHLNIMLVFIKFCKRNISIIKNNKKYLIKKKCQIRKGKLFPILGTFEYGNFFYFV